MLRRSLLAGAVAAVAGTLLIAAITLAAADSSSTSLTGVVESREEGAMEGVLVSATRNGSTLTTTVVSDSRGHYAFPPGRLEPGSYSIRIRAVGYELDGLPGVIVAGGATAQRDLKLRKTADLSTQLSNGEWFTSWPGSDVPHPKLKAVHGKLLADADPSAAAQVIVQQTMDALDVALRGAEPT